MRKEKRKRGSQKKGVRVEDRDGKEKREWKEESGRKRGETA